MTLTACQQGFWPNTEIFAEQRSFINEHADLAPRPGPMDDLSREPWFRPWVALAQSGYTLTITTPHE